MTTLADLPIANSVSGLVTFIVTLIVLPALAFFMRRAISRSDARNETVGDIVANMQKLTDRVDNLVVSSNDHDKLLSKLGENSLIMHTLLTGHLQWATGENGYLRQRLDSVPQQPHTTEDGS